ncbi:MAG: hypothetical protein ACXV4A_04665 [Actinomycetes bacterium]
MARPRDFLARFRPVGTPGSAAAAGVPVDRIAELGVELGPVLDALADTQAQAAAIRSAAAEDVLRRRRDGQARAEALLAAASSRAEADRLSALARARAEADTEVARAVAAAQAEAAAIEDRVADRLPALVERVRSIVRADLLEVPAGPDLRAGSR